MRTLLIWLVLACLLPGVIGAVALFMHEYRDRRAQQEKDMLLTARALVQAVDNHLLRGRAVAQTLASADALARGDFDRFHQRAKDAVEKTGLVTNVVLRDVAGRQILNTLLEFGQSDSAPAFPEQVRDVFATGKPVISNVFVGPVLKRSLVSVDVPVTIDDKVAYALGVGILPEHFSAILKAQNLPPGWVAAILDSTGTIVGRTHDAERFVGNKATAKLFQAMLEASEGSLEATTQEGTPVWTFFSRSPATDWRVAIGIPGQALSEALVLPISMLAAGVAALFAIGLILAWLIGGRIAHSVTALTRPAIALGSESEAQAPRVHIKEAAEVASAIDRAAALLKDRAASLRTKEAELAEAHRLARFGTWSWNLASGEVTTSDSIREIYGRDIPSFPEQRGTLLPVESWERINAASQEALRTGKGYDLELQVNHGLGYPIWINARCEAVLNERGEVVALRGTTQDITVQHAAKEAARESQQLLRTTMDNFPTVIAFKDEEGRFLDVNSVVEEALGLPKDRILGRTIHDFIPKEAADVLRKHEMEVMETRRATQSEKITPLPGGTLYHLDTSFPLIDTEGNVYGTGHISHDITERKEHERALRESERNALDAARQAETERRRLDAVLEATPVGIVVADANGAIVQANAAHRHLWGEQQPSTNSVDAYEEWKGWWADGSEKHGKRLGRQDWTMARALRGKEARDIVEIESFGTPPVRRIVLISGAPINDGDGRIIGGVIAQMDITDRMKAEESLRQADRRKDEFLAMLAHELRNPLAPIAAAADLLGFARLDESRVKQTSIIIARQVKHMTGLVDDLLDVSRVTRGLVKLDRHILNAERIVSDALEQVRPLMETRSHSLTVQLPAEPAFVLGDHKRLVQAATNLLNNAAKFTPDGGEIVLNLNATADDVELTVADNGIGMTAELVERAFELFAQGERTPDRSQGGLGIGLAIVKSLVELHGGSVTGYSDGIGKGSTFTVGLPRVMEKTGVLNGRQGATTIDTAAESLKVMIVDDNTDAAHMLAMFVEALGHRVFVEHGSRSAVERARAAAPNVCLLDIGLPEMDGNELARRLRAQPETANAILVAVTGYGQEHDRRKALDAGFDHHFVKPLDTEKLASLLGEIDKP